jgi:3-dehydroquinate dehydratase-2
MSYSAKSDRVLIINGPNLNLLGKREPEIYGTDTMDDILHRIRSAYPQLTIEYFQSNHEGAIIDELHRVGYDEVAYCGIVLNAGAYTHTSLAIADAISAIPVPVIEVHISNVHSREAIRHTSMISPVCRGVIAGFGADSYRLAIASLSK